MGLAYPPEVKLARRLLSKNSLNEPFDIRSLVEKFATITEKSIPIEGIDGICLHLKTPGKSPKIIVNSDSSRTRKNFTLAHELGHIIIPWHYGSIADKIEEDRSKFNTKYWELEREANRFASEVLMPFDWIYSLYQKNPDSEFLLREIQNCCDVSEMAAEIRLKNAIQEIEHILIPPERVLAQFAKTNSLAETQKDLTTESGLAEDRVAELMVRQFPSRIAYCIESDDIVIKTGGSPNSHPFTQWGNTKFEKKPYKYYKKYEVFSSKAYNTHWWDLEYDFEIDDDNREWREILDIIVNDVFPDNVVEYKRTINGKIAGAYSIWKQKKKGTITQFMADVIYRFNHPRFRNLLEHQDFLKFVKRRCGALG